MRRTEKLYKLIMCSILCLCLTSTIAQARALNPKEQLEEICSDLRNDITTLLQKAPNKDYLLYNNTLQKANLQVGLYNSFKCSPLKLKEIYDSSPALKYDVNK